MLRKIALSLGLVLALGACAGTAEVRATASLAIACDSYATALDELTILRTAGSLSEGDIAKIDTANALADPICGNQSTVNPAEVVGTVRAVTAQLKTIAGVN